MTMSDPRNEAPVTLLASSARLAKDDVVLPPLDVTSRGERVVLLGDATALVSTLAGTDVARLAPDVLVSAPPREFRVVGGELRVAGIEVAASAHLAPHEGDRRGGVLGVALHDPPLAPWMTPREVCIWSARLAGFSARTSADLADASLDRVGLGRMRRRMAMDLPLAARRALMLAQAFVADPVVVLTDRPFRGLDAEGVGFVMQALEAVTRERSAIVFEERVELGSVAASYVRGATDVLVFANEGLSAHTDGEGLFARGRAFVVAIQSNAEALGEALARRGVTMLGGPVRFVANLPDELGPSDVLNAASSCRAVVSDVYPLIA